MARVRNLDPGFFTNEELVELPFEFRLLFAGLWTLADREGRLEDRPKRIRMELFPCDAVNVDAGLRALHDAGLVVRYQVSGVGYLWIPKFHEHQRPHPRETASTIPPYPGGTPKADQGGALTTEPAPEGEPKANPGCASGEPKASLGSAEDAPRLPDSRTLGLSEHGEEQERAQRRTPAARGARIPDGFPAEPEFAWCRTHRPELDPLRVGQVFRDHHLAHGSTMKDWRAAWRTWVGKERAPLARASPGPPTAADRRAAFVASLTAHRPSRPTDDPSTIDVDPSQPAAPRLAARSG